MSKDLAKYLIYMSFQSQSNLESLLPILKSNCSNEEYKEYGLAIARILTKINEELNERILKIHPDLKNEIEEKLKKYGRFF